MQAELLLKFWFTDIDRHMWFKKDTQFDQQLKTEYGTWHLAATRGELAHWRRQIRGRLAEIILLDQFSRNLFRDQAQSFANDNMALALAQEAIASGLTAELSATELSFLYMPYMHSESTVIHQQALPLFEALAIPEILNYELQHKAIIDKFGRYPHRNAILNRESTREEQEFLSQPGSSF